MSNTPQRKPVQNVGKLRILRNFGAIRPIPRNLQQLSWLAVSRISPAGQNIDKDLFILRLPSHRRQISPSDQQRKLQRWSHAQWNVELIVNRSNAGGSSPTWSPASPVYRSENTDEDSVNVTIRHTVHKYMHIYDQCNFWATILPSTCVVISDLLSVSCATVAHKNLISWCKQRDFFSRRVGARFMSISKRFYQHSGTIYRRSKSYLVVRISFDTVDWQKIMARYGSNFRWQPVFCHSDRWLCCDMHVDRKRPHMTADRPHSVVETVLTAWLLVIIYQQAFIVQADWGSVHCQIQQQTTTCCNAELSLWNHTYIATWTLDGKISGKIWKVIIWGPLFTLEKCGILIWSLYCS